MILFMKGKELTIFGQLKIPIKFSINLNLKFLRLLNCLHMIFLLLYYVTHNLIKDKLISFINQTFIGENTQYLACNKECAFFTIDVYTNFNLWSCQKVCDAIVYLLDNTFIRFETKLFKGKQLVFRWELIVLLLLQICFFFVMS